MRRLLGIIGIAVVGGLLLSVGVAGAQTTTTTTTTTTAAPAVFTCEFVLSTASLPVGGGPVQVSGTAPADSDVRIFVNGTLVTTAHSDPTTGAWGPVTVTITATSTISVSLTDYPATPCVGAGNVEVAVAAAAVSLPRTGANHTERYVLIGVAFVLVGAALVIGARRRHRTNGRV